MPRAPVPVSSGSPSTSTSVPGSRPWATAAISRTTSPRRRSTPSSITTTATPPWTTTSATSSPSPPALARMATPYTVAHPTARLTTAARLVEEFGLAGFSHARGVTGTYTVAISPRE